MLQATLQKATLQEATLPQVVLRCQLRLVQCLNLPIEKEAASKGCWRLSLFGEARDAYLLEEPGKVPGRTSFHWRNPCQNFSKCSRWLRV
ncbi:hypothetical protein NA78x_002297 [Anatilimnocola sp. NA78]|uniref:hypothetical protein n=1 Tax=Anatilimnocola sp. NA78 TaxID=3415683 RepID=UPI003CE49543